MAKGNRIIVGLKCSECERINYTTFKNRVNTKDKVEVKKHCKWCGKHTAHKECKVGKKGP